MSYADPSHAQAPSRLGPGSAIQPALELDDLNGDNLAPPPRRLNVKLIWRALQRYWWQALTIWIVGSSALMVLAYYKVKPTYTAIAQIKIEQGEQKIFSNSNIMAVNFEEYKETQVKTMTNPIVLSTALAAHPELNQLPRLRGSEDPEAEIRAALQVMIIRGTNLIQVGMTSEFSHEAVSIVNNVVEAYLKQAADVNDQERVRRLTTLRQVAEERKEEVIRRRKQLVEKQKAYGTSEVEVVKNKNNVTLDSYAALSRTLLQVQIEKAKEEAYYNQLNSDRSSPVVHTLSPDQLEQQVEMLFRQNPKVDEIQRMLDKQNGHLAEALRLSRNPNDAAAKRAKNAIAQLNSQLNRLREDLRPKLSAQLAMSDQAEDQSQLLAQAKQRVDRLLAEETTLSAKLNEMNIASREAGEQQLELQFLNADMQRADAVLSGIQQVLDQAEYDNRNSPMRSVLQFQARQSARPDSNNRLKVMAVAPLGMMLMVVGFLVLMEKQAARVGDPDELPGRLNLQVLGVVPPLPQVRTSTHSSSGEPPGAGDYRSQRQLDEFVQSLDHLRVALVNGKGSRSQNRRCLLITSACGSEGKTTLAAQLAERCVNAGLTTLLIDGDLRNPTLSRVLDMPDRRGLINVLRDEISTEEALTVIGGAGGFHLLPAGTPRVDPSRLLHGDRLGKILVQLRESFDIVIVDAPPVLPVPDALTIGRWTDGAVLAVRYDTSRFPLVERANRRLASVGVPVLGAVVNGVRTSSSSYYGSYYSTTAVPERNDPMLDV